MFNDGRSKRVVFVAHCFLNQNSISDGTAVYPAAFKDLVGFFLNAVQQILEYDKSGFEIVGMVGANRSPNCGVDTTSDRNEEISGMGLFIEEISSRLSNMDITIPMIGLKGNDNIIERLQQLL